MTQGKIVFLMGETLACLNADGEGPGEDADGMGEMTSDGQRFSGGQAEDSHGQMLGGLWIGVPEGRLGEGTHPAEFS